MTSVEFRNGDWGALRGEETTKLDREILADIAGRQNDLGLRWFSWDLFLFTRMIGDVSQGSDIQSCSTNKSLG